MRSSDRGRVLPLALLLAALLAVDVLLLAGDWAWRNGIGAFGDWRWDTERDGGWLELFRAAQLVAAAVVLGLVARRRRRDAPVLWAWAFTLVVIAVDDVAALHERGGEALVGVIGMPSAAGLRPQDLGEMLGWAFMMLALGALLAVTYRRSSADVKVAARWVGAGVALLVTFAVVADMAHAAVTDGLTYRMDYVFTLVEAGGESAACAVVLVVALWIHRSRPPEARTGAQERADAGTSRRLAA